MNKEDLAKIVIDGMTRSNNVPDWPADEQSLYRDGYASTDNPAGWRSFTERTKMLQIHRASKVVEAVLEALAPPPGMPIFLTGEGRGGNIVVNLSGDES